MEKPWLSFIVFFGRIADYEAKPTNVLEIEDQEIPTLLILPSILHYHPRGWPGLDYLLKKGLNKIFFTEYCVFSHYSRGLEDLQNISFA